MTTDKWMLWGAAGVMAAVGSFSIYKIRQTPAVEPDIVRLEKALDVPAAKVSYPAPAAPKIPSSVTCGPILVEAGRVPMKDWTGFVATKAVGIPVPPTPQPVFILPQPVMQREAVADLDGITISWTLKAAEGDLQDWMKRKEAKPTGFVITRQREGGPVERLATLNADARSYTDLSVEPRKTYRYWIALTGQETDLEHRPLKLVEATRSDARPAESRIPSGVRMKLIGGDATIATLKMETYDRQQKKWVSKMTTAAPGREIGTSGWTLKALHFDKFTLVADLLDADGGVQVLTTKN